MRTKNINFALIIIAMSIVYILIVLYVFAHTNHFHSEPKTYDILRGEINKRIEDEYQNEAFGSAATLSDACKYVLDGGKRLRSIIVLEVARRYNELYNTTPTNCMDAALAIEYIHNASLIIDDLPEFDDDLYRRGKLSLHIVESPAVARLTSSNLIFVAMTKIAHQIDWIKENNSGAYRHNSDGLYKLGMDMYDMVWRKIGASGAIGGQYMDTISSMDEMLQKFGEFAVVDMLYKKTATFYELSFGLGYLSAGGSIDMFRMIERAGKYFGLAYQIADDIGDYETDVEKRCWNFAHVYSLETAYDMMKFYLQLCRNILKRVNFWTPLFVEIFEKLIGMTNNQTNPTTDVVSEKK